MPITLNGTNGITTPLDVEIQGSTSGSITIAVPAVAGSNTQTLVATTGTLAPIVSGTEVASTSGTSIDFTGIPNWVKRITVACKAVSLSGSANILIQIGSGSVTSTGYVSSSSASQAPSSVFSATSTAGAVVIDNNSSNVINCLISICHLGSNNWVFGLSGTASGFSLTGGGSSPTLGGALDRVRITTTNGTDTFDSGSINILYE